MIDFSTIKGILCDLNGVVYEDDAVFDGVREAIEAIRGSGRKLLFCTNTTIRSVDTLQKKLAGFGLPIAHDDIFGVTTAAAAYLKKQGDPELFLVMNDDTKKDFADFKSDCQRPDYIVLGEIGRGWSYDLLNDIFYQVAQGAKMLALHKGKYWQTEGRLRLSVGAFVTGLEYATDSDAIVVGKPSTQFYFAALAKLGLPSHEVAMIGDDITSDVGGAQALGMKGILVRTGKYREELVAQSDVAPDLVIEGLGSIKGLM